MEANAFDRLAQTLATGVTRRSLLLLAGVGAGVAVGAAESAAEAARRGASRRRKRRRGAKSGNQGGARPAGGNAGGKPDDCPKPEACAADRFTGQPGKRCDGGRCSCGGVCCGRDFACFIDDALKREICCFDNGGTDTTQISKDAAYAVCIADRDVCCTVDECTSQTCRGTDQGITPSRYRRNPR
ncbi:MAG: hypothetical protein QM692_02120 [Thermomicrobiales bacterium]